MSTTFDVYPRTKQLPSFGALLDRSTLELHHFLKSVGVQATPQVHFRIQRHSDHSHLPVSVNDPLQWSSDHYAWFMVDQAPGGTDAYYDDKPEEYWVATDAPRYKILEPLIRECLLAGRRWTFRRSAGQPAVINLAYGIIAASLAAITNGFLTSEDGGWDWERMPALPDEFLSWYFRPEQAINENKHEWSKRCLGFIADELAK